MTVSANEAHAVLAPSSAYCWVECPGSRALRQAYPEREDSEAAMEGTAAHWVFEQMLKAKRADVVKAGMLAPNGVEVTEEMLDGGEMFCDCVGMEHHGHVEKRVTMAKSVHAANWGTPDFFGLRNGVLRVVDYKYGHRYVDEFENWQGIDYIAGAIEFLDIRPEHETQIEFTIVQPRHFGRAGPVRTWSTNIRDIQPYIQRLRDAAHSAMQDNAPCLTGDHCRYCSGRMACEALGRAVGGVLEMSGDSLPLELPIPVAARELTVMQRAADILQARITGLSEQLLYAGRSGAQLPGYSVERAEGRQKWIKPVPEVMALGQMLGVDLGKPSVITPKQAVKAGIPEAVVAGMSEVPLGEWKLVKTDDSKARRAFGGAA